MRHVATLGAAALLLLLPPTGASAKQAHHVESAKCAVSSRTLLSDAKAQIYFVREGQEDYFNIRGCAYGQRRSFFLATCDRQESATACAKRSSVKLEGSVVAYEDPFVVSGRDIEGTAPAEWYVEVRDLRTGQLLHKTPTGVALTPRPRYVGVGPLVALVLKSDGAVAWIADDYERSQPGTAPEVPYFDVYAVDKSGTRLVASGTGIDPSSLGLSVGGINVPFNGRSVTGSTLYWTQNGTSFATALS